MPSANMLGIDVAGLDVEAFLRGARYLFVLLALAWLALLVRVKRPAWLLLGVIAANAYLWGVTNYPLQRIYALGPSYDRINNLGLCQVVAAGNSPLHTVQVGQLHFEPFWGLLVALLSGWSPERVLRLYPFLPLVVVTGFALALYYGLDVPGAGEGWSAWERALMAGFATLLSSSPFDFVGTYRVPWALTFLLKPNHALGFLVFPLFLKAFLSIRGWRGRLTAGLVLHLLGWVFVLHMVYVSCGLLVFAVMSLLAREGRAGRDTLDVVTVLGVNFLVVSPYLYMLFVGYPFLVPSATAAVPVWSPHLLEVTLRLGAIFWLAVWGAMVAQRSAGRLGRLWVAQLLGALLVWVGYLALSPLQLARELDEIHHWFRFLVAATAGLGAWDLARRAARRLFRRDLDPALRAAAIGVLALPWSIAYWWDPSRMDAYFARSLPPIEDALRRPTDFLRQKTPPQAVVATNPEFARYVAALGARRVLRSAGMHLPRDAAERMAAQERLVRDPSPESLSGAVRFGVQYLVATPALLAENPGTTLRQLEARPHLRLVHLSGDRERDFVAIFRLVPSS